ncbi:F-box protein CPR1-like [Impatiens glandulifera]|uniref:F-box protein CPR1-like n=1 Tax=Impatiens glandulifera TaxID=253017 RepID=UPI001FB0BC46|nr:F-box protein CPR1-like [Impatiens glandulifera]
MASFFPDEILENVLCRLPVKSLLRLRCISKSWLSLISSPRFVKLHLNRSVQTKSNLSLFLITGHEFFRWNLYSLDHDLQPPEVINHPIDGHPFRYRWYTIGSCHGLICLSNSIDDTIYLWNPSTKKSIKLPYANPSCSCYDRSYGFGYDNTNDDYRVVRTVLGRDAQGDIINYEINVYSLRSNSWHMSEKFHHCPNFESKNVIACGALHWISGNIEEEEKSWIVAFNLGTEKYRVIPTPEYSGPHYIISLNNFEEYLSLSCHYYSNVVDVWLLNEYGGKNEYWSKLISLPPTEPQTDSPNFQSVKPIAYSKSGKKVLLQMDYISLAWYNLEDESVEDIMLHDLGPFFDFYSCLESLVSVDVTAAEAAMKKSVDDGKMKKQTVKD